MKKIICIIFSLFFVSNVFSETYKINNVDFNIEGKTKAINILQNCPINRNINFKDIKELDTYIANYKIKLANLRVFDKIDIQYEKNTQDNEETKDEI